MSDEDAAEGPTMTEVHNLELAIRNDLKQTLEAVRNGSDTAPYELSGLIFVGMLKVARVVASHVDLLREQIVAAGIALPTPLSTEVDPE